LNNLEFLMRFSLIVATKGRTTEVGAFLDSLRRQQTTDFEVIIVDQNGDDRLQPIISLYTALFPILWLRSAVANSSHARNLGIAAANGEILTFPDDDCIYPDALLSKVDQHFIARPTLGLLTGPARAPSGTLGSGRWTMQSCTPDYRNIWTCIIEFNMFFRPASLPALVRFDEEIGVGARFGSGEGADLAISLKRAGAVLFYDFDLYVTHPDKALTDVAVQRAFAYGTGFGRVMRKHCTVLPKTTVMKYIIRPFGGMLVAILRARPLHVRYYTQTLRGRLHGFMADSRQPSEMLAAGNVTPLGHS
jgi:glycosyltransferase involved in cell wall biosynthesis